METEPAASGGLGMDTQNCWVQSHVLTFEHLHGSTQREDKPLSPLTLVVWTQPHSAASAVMHIALWLPGLQGSVSSAEITPPPSLGHPRGLLPPEDSCPSEANAQDLNPVFDPAIPTLCLISDVLPFP